MSKSQLSRLSDQVPEIKRLQERVVELEGLVATCAKEGGVFTRLEESLQTGYLLGNYNEPLDAYGKRLLRVILVEFDRARALAPAPVPKGKD